jgi:hypothetical protein
MELRQCASGIPLHFGVGPFMKVFSERHVVADLVIDRSGPGADARAADRVSYLGLLLRDFRGDDAVFRRSRF